MLVDLHYSSTEPKGIMADLAKLLFTHEGEDPFEHIDIGVYRIDSYKFNGEKFILDNCEETLIDHWTASGVCDDYKQVIDYHSDLVNDPNKYYVIFLSSVYRCDQPSNGGWRWCKWGEYIGTQNPTYEYIYNEPEIEKVYCYMICEVNKI